jgi:hypothetical protein
MTHPGGRPTKYNEEMNLKIQEYLDTCKDEMIQVVKMSGERGDTFENKLKVNLPTIGGLALYIGVAESTIQEWAKEHEEFSVSLRKVVKEQEKRLINSGLSGDYNSTIAKLVLSSNHGYKERSDQTTNDKDLPTPIINVPTNDSTGKD